MTVRLRRSDPDEPGISRVRRGRGFSYHEPEGGPVAYDVRERIAELVIPPAWREVWICPDPDGHLQAVGVDDAGRRQYRYHPRWQRARTEQKHDRVLTLARRLPEFRTAVVQQLDGRGATEDRVLAGGLRILDLGVFRTGGEEYAKANGTFGLATLRRDHVRLSGDELRFRYPAKHGILRDVRIHDAALAALVRTVRRAEPYSERLLVYRSGGAWHEVRAVDLNTRFQELTADEFTAKDLRTWNGTVLAAAAFAEHDPPSSERGRKQVRAAVMREVADGLGNTPAVARSSYVDPRVVRQFEQGRTIRSALRRIDDERLDPEATRVAVERAVIQLLSR